MRLDKLHDAIVIWSDGSRTYVTSDVLERYRALYGASALAQLQLQTPTVEDRAAYRAEEARIAALEK